LESDTFLWEATTNSEHRDSRDSSFTADRPDDHGFTANDVEPVYYWTVGLLKSLFRSEFPVVPWKRPREGDNMETLLSRIRGAVVSADES
jgi:hypothetical protein